MPRILTCVTIDTEADCDWRWRKRRPLQFRSVLEGIPGFLRPLFDDYGVKPVYFVSPEVIRDDGCCEVLKQEMEIGAEIGAHLHPEEMKDSGASGGKGFACSDVTDVEESEMLQELDRLLTARLGVKPTSYRAGRFGADIGTMRSLVKLGYTVDSSVTPHIDWSGKGGPDFRGFPEQPYRIDVEGGQYHRRSNSNLLEVPVTIGEKTPRLLPERWYFHKWLRPSNMEYRRMKILVDEYTKKYSGSDIQVLCMMFHSMEIIPRASPYVWSTWGQSLYLNKLRKIFEYLKSIDAEFLTLKDVSSNLEIRR